MDPVTVEIGGLVELQRILERLPRDVMVPILRGALREAAGEFKDGMVENAPKDTAFLSEHFNIKVSVKKEGVQGIAMVGPQAHMDYPNVDGGFREKLVRHVLRKIGRISILSVARYLEYGTRKLAPNHFMTRAFEQKRDVVLNKLIDALKASLARYGLK